MTPRIATPPHPAVIASALLRSPAQERGAHSPARQLWRDTVRYLADADAILGQDGVVHRRQVVRF